MINPPEVFGTDFVHMSALLGRYCDTDADVTRLIDLLGLRSGSRVLDAGCGDGRFAAALDRHGMAVVGVDISKEAITLARQSARGPLCVVADMARPPFGPYDAVVNVFSSFGYGATPADDAAVLYGWHAALRPGGRLIMELSDLKRARSSFGDRAAMHRVAATGVEEELSIDWESGILHVVYRHGDRVVDTRTRLYSREWLVDAVRDAGFVDIGCYGGFDGRERRPSDRLVLVATRRPCR